MRSSSFGRTNWPRRESALANDLYPKFDLNGQRLRAAYAYSYLQKGLP
jgi:hypothetical protein